MLHDSFTTSPDKRNSSRLVSTVAKSQNIHLKTACLASATKTVSKVQRLYPFEYYQHEVVTSALNKICRWETSILDYYQKMAVFKRYVEALIPHSSDCALCSLFCIWKTQCPSLVDASCNFVIVSSFKNTKHRIATVHLYRSFYLFSFATIQVSLHPECLET